MISPPSTQRNPGHLVACLLALTAGLVLLIAAESLRAPVSARHASDMDEPVNVARRFYDAVDTVLVTGDATALDEVVDADVVSHGSTASDAGHEWSVGDDSGREAMVASLLRLRALTPDLRVAVDWAEASSAGQVSVGLRTEGEESGSFAGLDVPAEARAGGWGPVEELRVEDGRVVERWPERPDDVRLEELARMEVERILEPSTRIMALVRLTLPPGSVTAMANEGGRRVLIVEAGRVSVTRTSSTPPGGVGPTTPDGDPVPTDKAVSTSPIELAAGRSLATDGRDRFTVAAMGPEPASLLVWALYSRWLDSDEPGLADAVAEAAAELEATTLRGSTPDVELDILGTDLVDLSNPTAMALGRVDLATGARLTWPGLRTSTLVVADPLDLEVSAVAGAPTAAATSASDPAGGLSERAGSPRQAAGTTMTWRAARSTTAYVFTFATAPAAAEEPPPPNPTPDPPSGRNPRPG